MAVVSRPRIKVPLKSDGHRERKKKRGIEKERERQRKREIPPKQTQRWESTILV